MADDSLELTVGDNSLELDVNPPYVGSAFSPEVDIEETTSTITVTITDARGEHSYSVPNTESAIADAEAATAAATSAASAATSAVSAAGTATTAANNAASAAASAASDASDAADLAEEKAGVAVQAASDANSAAEVASAKATLANNAASAANSAASAAGNAASAATSAAGYADTATRDASAAADAANSAAGAANAAAAAAESATATVDAAVASANSAAAYANEKGGAASNAANAANSAASSATSAASAANSAASAASTAATNADSKASAANTAAGAANTAATAATSAATAANTSAEAANTAAEYASEFTEAYLPMVTAGVSESLLATDVTMDTFAQRVSDHDGACRITSLRGNTIVESGELVSVNIEGMKITGRNLFDKTAIYSSNGYLNASGEFVTQASWRVSDYMPIIQDSQITISGGTSDSTTKNCWYTASKEFISSFNVANSTVTPPSNAAFLRCSVLNNRLDTLQVERGASATDYVPYREITREIPPSTLFSDGILRSAGSAYDERTPTRDIKRVGVVDLGTLTWSAAPIQGQQDTSRYYTPVVSDIVKNIASSQIPNIVCSKYQAITVNSLITANTGIAVNSFGNVTVYDDALKNVSTADFKNAMSGVMLYYELATPTETTIDPPLNLAYPTEQGGTESIIIPEGSQSAPPTMAVVYAYNADGVRDISQAIIANIEGATASTNYAIGGYFVHAGRLYKATSAIATGETINPGTNCTQTTVMAELLALTA